MFDFAAAGIVGRYFLGRGVERKSTLVNLKTSSDGVSFPAQRMNNNFWERTVRIPDAGRSLAAVLTPPAIQILPHTF